MRLTREGSIYARIPVLPGVVVIIVIRCRHWVQGVCMIRVAGRGLALGVTLPVWAVLLLYGFRHDGRNTLATVTSVVIVPAQCPLLDEAS